ncbi:MAG: omptin family outer membrane protease [Chlorobi bacterium]|nr:omptin family outer membrane protease [Chlorobiota bacterium]
MGVNIGSSVRINGTVKTNIAKPDDPMIDKDWITDSDPTRLDIYSDSSISDFDALILDCDVEWSFLKSESGSLYAGIGYQYQNFKYDSNLIHQYSPSGLPGWEFFGDGGVSITYEMTYSMPYVILGGAYNVTPEFALAGSVAYSPFVDAEDLDNHILRDKISEGDMEGSALMVNVSGTYSFAPNMFLEGGLNYTWIDVDGTQTQSFSGVPIFLVSQEAESSQTSGYLKIGYRF